VGIETRPSSSDCRLRAVSGCRGNTRQRAFKVYWFFLRSIGGRKSAARILRQHFLYRMTKLPIVAEWTGITRRFQHLTAPFPTSGEMGPGPFPTQPAEMDTSIKVGTSQLTPMFCSMSKFIAGNPDILQSPVIYIVRIDDRLSDLPTVVQS
jgi:hypothetical protein